ncbi:MAG: glycosyltransferase family 4 protein [Fibrobacteria bacterium]|nr:glycosyltransferase family 4 protein [Fibrobacteria bacterium]
MEILHLIYDDLDNPWLGGGGAVCTRAIAAHMSQKKYKTTILVGAYPGSKEKQLEDNVRVVPIGWGNNYLMSRLSYTIYGFFFLVFHHKKYALIVDDASPFSPVFSYLFQGRTPVIGNFQNIFKKHIFNKYPHMGFLPYTVEAMSHFFFKTTIVMSPFMRDYMRSKKDCYPIPNGINLEDIPVFSKTPPFPEQKYIAFLGRIDIYQKGLDLLLDALIDIKTLLEQENVVVLVAGDGSDMTRYKNLIEEKKMQSLIKLTGRIEGDKRYHFLRKALFTVMPSRYEALSLVLLESQACGAPLIATDIPTFNFIINHNINGYLLPTESAPHLARGIQKLLGDAEFRKKLSDNALEYSKKYDRTHFLKIREKLYLRIMNPA